jgi:hypothetical protein
MRGQGNGRSISHEELAWCMIITGRGYPSGFDGILRMMKSYSTSVVSMIRLSQNKRK